jgi:hypothetical protein
VVSVAEKAGQVARQVWIKKASESEPLMTCRNRQDDIKTGLSAYGPGRAWGRPAYCPGGVRHGGGASLVWALVRNVGTRRLDTVWLINGVQSLVAGESENLKGQIPEGQSSDAGHGGGPSRSSEEGPVMGLERRGRVTADALMVNHVSGRSR